MMSDAIMAFNMVRGRSTFFDAQIPRKTMSQSFHSSLYVGKVLEQTSYTYHKNVPSSLDSNLFLRSINYYDFNEIRAIKSLYLIKIDTRNLRALFYSHDRIQKCWVNIRHNRARKNKEYNPLYCLI